LRDDFEELEAVTASKIAGKEPEIGLVRAKAAEILDRLEQGAVTDVMKQLLARVGEEKPWSPVSF